MRATWLALSLMLPAVAQIRVMTPDWLVKDFATTNGRIEGSTATFGAPFYGDRVLGRLVFGESTKGMTHCNKDDYSVPDPVKFASSTSKSEEVRLINIIMVRRGNCSFTKKVKVAYEKGAHAVIIVDKEESELTAKDMQNIIVADDGFGGNIHIPSVLVSKEDGKRLIAAVLRRKAEVIVELAWDLPTNHVVNTDLWMSAASMESLKFLKEFAPKRRVLNEVVVFNPHYAVFGMESTDPQNVNELCSDSTGQYCAEDPDGAGPITGAQVLDEDVRQLCIHESHKVRRESVFSMRQGLEGGVDYAAKYWDYIEKLMDSCPLDAKRAEDRFGLECSEKLMEKVGIDVDRVQDCVRQNKTKFLRDQREHPAWSPRALRINGWRYSGILDADLVTRAICSGFITQPPECKEIIKPRNPFQPYYITKTSGVSFMQMLIWLVTASLIMFVGMLLYKRYLKKEMRTTLREEVMLEVQAQMGDYTKMRNNC